VEETCPDDEELAAFLDGILPPAERARVVRHLAGCEDCYWVFVESLLFLTHGEGE